MDEDAKKSHGRADNGKLKIFKITKKIFVIIKNDGILEVWNFRDLHPIDGKKKGGALL